MTLLNAAITRCFDIFFAPFVHANPWLGMIAISLASGVVLLLVFRWTSNQRAIRAAKDRIIAHLLELVLYRDELPVVLRAQFAVFRDNLRYLGHALVPLAFMILPVGVLLVQTDLRYGHRPLRVGERAIVAVTLQPDMGSLDSLSIVPTSGIEVQTPALRIPALREVDWRIVATTPGIHHLRFRMDSAEFTKRIIAGPRASRVSTQRVKAGLRRQFLHPGEPPLPAAGLVQSVRVTYPSASLPFFGWRLHWLWPWLILSMAFGYALRGPLRVQV